MIILSVKEKDAIEKCIDVLASGGLLVVPTDTFYGVIGDATREHVIFNLFLLKKRSQKKPFPIFVKDIAMARHYAYISDSKAQFLQKIWPGQITVLLYHKEKLPSLLTTRAHSIGIRIPDHPFLQKLLAQIDTPLVQTSANVSGDAPAKNIEDVKRYFQHSRMKPECVIDGGEISHPASTVIDFTRNTPIIVRTGLVSKTELDRLLEQF